MSKIKELLEQERIDDTTCPRCDFDKALFHYNAFNLQDTVVFCFRCGLYDYSGIKLDHDLSFDGWEHTKSCPLGFLCVKADYTDLSSNEEILEKAAWLHAEIAAGRVNSAEAYLTRWNEGTGQVELLGGAYPWESEI